MYKSKKNIITIAFYNVENLFDTKDNPFTADDDYTAKGKRSWNTKRYHKKVKKLSKTIAQLGVEESKYLPIIVGLVEVENKNVLLDLISRKSLKNYYRFIHYDSPDERGIDTALLYQPDFFEVLYSKTYPLYLYDDDGSRDYTRDVLLVCGKLQGETVYILVNHWPSRREGLELTEPNRIKAAELVCTIIDEIKADDTNAKIIVMGDFNDNPTNKSMQLILQNDFYNPMQSLFDKGLGTLTHEKKWYLFDQILLSKNLTNNNGLHFTEAKIYNKKWLKVFKGKLKGSPFRTYIGPWYKGGVSDHFPVYVQLEKVNK